MQPDPAAGLADGEDDGRRSILRLQLKEGRRLQQRAELAQVLDPKENECGQLTTLRRNIQLTQLSPAAQTVEEVPRCRGVKRCLQILAEGCR